MPGTQITTIVTQVAALLAAVPTVQRVHLYEPVALLPETIPTTIGSSQAIEYWVVRPRSTQPVREVGAVLQLQHAIRFEHYRSVGDAATTTAAIDALLLAVFNAFSLVFSLTPQAEVTGPLEVTAWPQLVKLAETFLVYRSEMILPVHERVVVA